MMNPPLIHKGWGDIALYGFRIIFQFTIDLGNTLLIVYMGKAPLILAVIYIWL